MNPLFKPITTPNGKYKIEGYEVDKFHYREESNETILINKGETPDVCVGKPYKLSNITEEMAKSWGYGCEYPNGEIVDCNLQLHSDISAKLKDTNLSNILLILIEV